MRDDAYRMSPATSQLSIAPWPAPAATGNTPTDARNVEHRRDLLLRWRAEVGRRGIARRRDHLGRAPAGSVVDRRPITASRTWAAMSCASAIARKDRWPIEPVFDRSGCGAGRRAARRPRLREDARDERRVSAGSVSLAAATHGAPPGSHAGRRGCRAHAGAGAANGRAADRRPPCGARGAQANELREAAQRGARVIRPTGRQACRALPISRRRCASLDVAVKAIDQRTKAATDSAIAIRLQAPTFKKIKIAEIRSRTGTEAQHDCSTIALLGDLRKAALERAPPFAFDRHWCTVSRGRSRRHIYSLAIPAVPASNDPSSLSVRCRACRRRACWSPRRVAAQVTSVRSGSEKFDRDSTRTPATARRPGRAGECRACLAAAVRAVPAKQPSGVALVAGRQLVR